MNADADHHPLAARTVRLLRQCGRLMRRLRGNDSAFFEACTALDLDGWRPHDFPGVVAGAAASALIEQQIVSPLPSLVCRLGTTELAAMASATQPLTMGNVLRMMAGDGAVRDIGLHPGLVAALCELSGFFPQNLDAGRRFVQRMVADLSTVDVLGSWCRQETLFARELAGAQRVRFRDLEPYMHERPWTRALAGRRVLVVHPFASTIESQYHGHRQQLFSNPEVLPEFELQTLRAVQSIANTPVPFDSWFDALRHMEDGMAARDWDVALIGCGAYGLPLAAHAKRLGRKGVHLGGQTQLLFGIKGKRWDRDHGRIKAMFNEHWVLPGAADRPAGYTRVEGGAYW